MEPKHWLRDVVSGLQAAGLTHVTGQPLLAASQYDVVVTLATGTATRILQVAVVSDTEIVHTQVWWHRDGTVDVHVFAYDTDFVLTAESALLGQWMFTNVHPLKAQEIVLELANGLKPPKQEHEYCH